MKTNREQELIDILFQCVLTVDEKFVKKSAEEKAQWVVKQLKSCGFETEPIGLSWGLLIKK